MLTDLLPKCLAEDRVSIHDQELPVAQESINRIGGHLRDLLHEQLVRVRRNPDELNGTRRKIDDDERVVSDEAPCGPSLGGEKVGGSN